MWITWTNDLQYCRLWSYMGSNMGENNFVWKYPDIILSHDKFHDADVWPRIVGRTSARTEPTYVAVQGVRAYDGNHW